ncbi:MAG: hypothetical protein ACLPOO_02150 [Terriglobales bacterium]
MSLLRDIQNAALDSTVHLPDLLRKCKVLAVRLGNEDLKRWVDSELNGYGEDDSLPAYRSFRVESHGDFFGPAGSGLRNAPIPLSCLPEKFVEMLFTHHSREPISAFADLVSKGTSGSFRVPWPADLVAHVGQDIYEYMNCASAWQVIPRGAIVGILDTVRSRILNFALEIEAEAPEAGEAAPGVPPVPQERVNQVFHTQIFGNVGNVAAGSEGFSQSSAVVVVEGDFSSLRTFLTKLGIDSADLSELENSAAKDRESLQDGMGPHTGRWLGKMISKASSGALQVGTTVATTLLTKALTQYLGLPM